MTARNQRSNDSSDRQTEVDSLAVGRQTLTTEARALNRLAEELNGDFLAALECMESIKGRVIVTGMGKSGHVGAKMAATLASTGRPAFFVHPGEASHGDLGMVTPDDCVIALSNSGNTAELGDIISFTRRFGIPLIAITRKAESLLGEAADIVLQLPDVDEACPMGLAPTTSTTATMALGDALAVTLLERRNFKAEDFKVFHPGGSLGNKLTRVEELMHGVDELPLCAPDTPMSEAILTITAHRFGCVGVTDGQGRLQGIVTDGDLRRHMAGNLLDRPTGEIMTREPRCIRPQALAAEALHLMNMTDRPFTTLFVTEDDKPIGILHIHDLLRAGLV
ncbi:KpsF/GutQ family sugar-phosphate isomerase [Rhodovibrionaceae bacterium A322]